MSEIRESLFFLPDPLMTPDIISGAVMLYFDGPFLAISPPTVVTPESLKMLELVEARKPRWAKHIFRIVHSLKVVSDATSDTWEKIRAIEPTAFTLLYLGLPANRDAYRRVDDWVAASGYDYESLLPVIRPALGGAELARHIFLERYLELGSDVESLYDYCGNILDVSSIKSLIVSSYLLRLQVILTIPKDTRLLFTNEKLAPIIEKLRSLSPENDSTDIGGFYPERRVDLDVVAWEFFRVLVSSIIDPLDESRLALIGRIRQKHRDEMLRLRALCRELSVELSEESSVIGLGAKAMIVIESKLRKDLRDMFEIDETTWRMFLDGLATDKVLWSSLVGVIAGAAGSGPMFTAAGLVSALTCVGTSAVKARAAREEKLRESDLALLRLLSK